MTEKKEAITVTDVLTALDACYPSPAWAFLPQVREGTGWGAARTADAIAMSLWPSRGLEVIGFEIKTSRSDWARELRDPEKAEAIFSYCDRWYVVAAHDGIVGLGELPPTWGLKVLRGGLIETETEAPKLTPVALDRVFIAAIMRRLHNLRADKKEIDRCVEAALGGQRANLARELDGLKAEIVEFEHTSGVALTPWHAGQIGEAVRWALNGGVGDIREQLEAVRRTAKQIADSVDRALREEVP